MDESVQSAGVPGVASSTAAHEGAGQFETAGAPALLGDPQGFPPPRGDACALTERTVLQLRSILSSIACNAETLVSLARQAAEAGDADSGHLSWALVQIAAQMGAAADLGASKVGGAPWRSGYEAWCIGEHFDELGREPSAIKGSLLGESA